MEQKKEKSYHHGNLKKALVDSAMEIIAEEGYKSLTLRKVAVHAGVSVGAPYRHYKNAEELLSEVASEGLKILSRKIKKKIEQKPKNYLWQFQSSGIAYVELAIEHKELFRI
ncbi:MAG: TetR/AcrR family transcriptional regulator, partial [Spirochaetota bacterium]